MDKNQNDIFLLNNNPNQLILELQDLIDIIVYQFIRSGYFNYNEKQDVKQQINIELFNRVDTIQIHYKGKSLLRTYIGVVIRNICNEILRDKKKSKYILVENNLNFEGRYDDIDPLIMDEEMSRLRKIIELYFNKKYKLILCLKLKFKMVIELDDFRNINKNITPAEFGEFIDLINPYMDCPDNTMFMGLTLILNKYEHKDNTPDSLRKWVTDKINELIDILNGNPPTSNYNKESFQILFEKCYYE
jgi:hypothetical protein